MFKKKRFTNQNILTEAREIGLTSEPLEIDIIDGFESVGLVIFGLYSSPKLFKSSKLIHRFVAK